MQFPAFRGSVPAVATACLRLTLAIVTAGAASSLASIGEAASIDPTIPTIEASTLTDQGLPLDAMGYLGGLFEARFYEPHAATVDPRDEIRELLPCTELTWR
jgi:hypothetical protein